MKAIRPIQVNDAFSLTQIRQFWSFFSLLDNTTSQQRVFFSKKSLIHLRDNGLLATSNLSNFDTPFFSDRIVKMDVRTDQSRRLNTPNKQPGLPCSASDLVTKSDRFQPMPFGLFPALMIPSKDYCKQDFFHNKVLFMANIRYKKVKLFFFSFFLCMWMSDIMQQLPKAYVFSRVVLFHFADEGVYHFFTH